MQDQTTKQENTTIQPASLRDRGLAWLVDTIIRMPLTVSVVLITIGSKSLTLALALLVVREAYKPVMEAVYGYTIGKRVLKIKVVSAEDQAPISWNQSLLRFIPWAIAFYTEVFVTIRYYQAPGFSEATDFEAYIKFQETHPLYGNFWIGILGVAWVFSAMWILSDPLRRALHDQLGRTLVVEDKSQKSVVDEQEAEVRF